MTNNKNLVVRKIEPSVKIKDESSKVLNEQEEADLEVMASSGVHLGSLRSYGHPKMKPYIWSGKNVFQIIDLEKSKVMLTKATDFLVSVKKKGGVILFVGTGLASKDMVKDIAEGLNMPYVVERWLGGTLTLSLIHI